MKKLGAVVNALYFMTFLGVFTCIIIWGYTDTPTKYNPNSPELHITVIVGFALITALFVFVNRFLFGQEFGDRIKQRLSIDSRKITTVIIFSLTAIMLVLQFFCAWKLKIVPDSDLSHVERYAVRFARTGSFDGLCKPIRGGYYLIRYPNNFGLYFIMAFTYRLSYLITGNISRIPLIVINVFAINSTVLMTTLLARRLFGNRKALFALLLCALFTPFYTYTAFYYTDSLSLPFVIGSVYLAKTALSNENKKKKYVLLGACGLVIFLGFKLKGNEIVMVVAVVVYLFLKYGFKRAACLALAVVIGFGVSYAAYSAAFRLAVHIPGELFDKYEMPYTHWVMMGLNGKGGYNREDSRFSNSFANIDEKKAADIKVIKERLVKYGVIGLIKHLKLKATWEWEDGTYFISRSINTPVKRNFLHEFVSPRGRFYFGFYSYSCMFLLFVIMMMFVSGFRAMRGRETDFLTLLRLAVFGLFLFLLIWEGRSRYLFNFSPLFLLISVDGMRVFDKLKKRPQSF